jgi:D-3-phosphoglycerate dehydrogenase
MRTRARIGREIARRAQAFGMRLLAYDLYVTEETLKELGIEPCGLEALIRRADFVVPAAKVTPETQGILSRERIRLMKPTAYLVNTARAALLDYSALHDALRDRAIAGAALDVFPEEPMPDSSPFRRLDNVLLSPHLAGASTDVHVHHSRMAVDDLLLAFSGVPSRRLANPEIWERSRLCRACSE